MKGVPGSVSDAGVKWSILVLLIRPEVCLTEEVSKALTIFITIDLASEGYFFSVTNIGVSNNGLIKSFRLSASGTLVTNFSTSSFYSLFFLTIPPYNL